MVNFIDSEWSMFFSSNFERLLCVTGTQLVKVSEKLPSNKKKKIWISKHTTTYMKTVPSSVALASYAHSASKKKYFILNFTYRVELRMIANACRKKFIGTNKLWRDVDSKLLTNGKKPPWSHDKYLSNIYIFSWFDLFLNLWFFGAWTRMETYSPRMIWIF